MTTKNFILLLSISFCQMISTMDNKNNVVLDHRRTQLQQNLAPRFYNVNSPCHCIHDSCYTNKKLAQDVNRSINLPTLKDRKKSVHNLKQQVILSEKENYARRSENIAVNFYGDQNCYLNNLATLTQKNLELQHAQSLLSHVEKCDAALTLQTWRRTRIAQKETEKLRNNLKLKQQEEQEQKGMKQEDVLTKRFNSFEKQQALQQIKDHQAAEFLRLEEAKKEAQRQKSKENNQKKAEQEKAELQAQQLKKEQEQQDQKRKQKAQAQLKKEEQAAAKKAAQDKEIADLAYLTDMASQSKIDTQKQKINDPKKDENFYIKTSKIRQEFLSHQNSSKKNKKALSDQA